MKVSICGWWCCTKIYWKFGKRYIFNKFGKPKEMIMTEESEHNYLNAT